MATTKEQPYTSIGGQTIVGTDENGQPVAAKNSSGGSSSSSVSNTPSATTSSTPASTTPASSYIQRVTPTTPPSSVQGGDQNLTPNSVDGNNPDPKSLSDYENADYTKLIGQSSEYLDTINQSANQAEAESAIAARGLAAETGTQGSPSAETMKEGDIAKIETQRKVDIGNALQTIQTNAETMANNEYGADLNARALAKSDALDAVKTLASNPSFDLNKFKATNPQEYQNLVDHSGESSAYVDALFGMSIPSPEITNTWNTSDGANGTTVWQERTDPITKKVSLVPTTFPGVKIPIGWTTTKVGNNTIISDPNNPADNYTYFNDVNDNMIKIYHNNQLVSTMGGGSETPASNNSYDLSTYATNAQYPNLIADTVNKINTATGSTPITTAEQAQAVITQLNANSPITGEMIMTAANQYGVDPAYLIAIAKQETQLGTDGSTGAKGNNYTNYGNTDGAMANGKPVNYTDPQISLNNTAKWLSQHPSQSAPSNINNWVSSFSPAQQNDLNNAISGAGKNKNAVLSTMYGVINGTIPPTSSGMGGATIFNYVRAGMAATGQDLTQLTNEWTATQKYIASANSPAQVRLKQAIGSVTQGIGQLKSDAQKWNAGGFAPLNAANLKIALSGAYGQDAQTIAASFQQQSTIIQDELGQTFMGGNSPTDKALDMAGSVFNTSWSYDTLSSALDQLNTNLNFRMNAINSVNVGGLGGGNDPYAPNNGSGTSGGDTTSQITSLGGKDNGDGTFTMPDGTVVTP